MFTPIFIKTPNNNLINLSLVTFIKRAEENGEFLIKLANSTLDKYLDLEFNTREKRDEFYERICSLICCEI